MQRPTTAHRGGGGSRPPSVPPHAGIKRKERDFERDTVDETNINVVVRCRGRNEREVKENSGVVVSTNGVNGKTVELCMGPNAISNKTYAFDKVFSPAADQAIIFDDVVAPFLGEMLDGYNCTIFAYGQTGTGKTYTMSGDMTETYGLLSDAAGIIPRVLQSLFQKVEVDEAECSVKCSFIELYNEELRDLLAADDGLKLKIYDDSNKKSNTATIVQGMEETHIKSAADGIKLLRKGSYRRQVAATKCNDLSSRSHTVFTITTYIKRTSESSEDFICSGKLNLVDLAGSENIQRSGAENKRAAEAGLINKSLLTLGRVINALVDKSAHIPYRESKLTRLLQDSLGGRTKTCIIATVSPAKSNLEETISTLDYAFRAKNIRNKPQINSMMSKKTLLREFTSEIEKLKSELIATRQRNGVYLSNEQFEEITVESESRRILSEEQRARIETMEVSLRNKVQELFSLTNNFTILKKDNDAARIALESTKDVLVKTEIVLKDTKRNLDEESTLRHKYAANEDLLHNMGGNLISAIGNSVRDMNGLHSKLRRRSELHHQNTEKWKSATSKAVNASAVVDDRLDKLQKQHSEMLMSVTSRIESFVSQEVERALKGKSVVQDGSAQLLKSTKVIEKQDSDARDSMNEVLEEIKVLRDDVKAKVGEGLQGLSEAAARISGEVISELDQFHHQLHTSYSGLGKDFKTMFEDLARQLATQREESDRLRSALREANGKMFQASLSATNQLEATLEIERRTSEEERDNLMQQISALISSSNSRRDERLTKAITATQTSVVEATEELQAADKFYGEGMDQWVAQDMALLEKVTRSKEEMKNRLKKDWSAVDVKNTAIQDSTKAVHKETIKIVDAQLEAMASQMAALDEFVTRARQGNDAHHEKHVATLRGMSAEVNTNFESLERHFDSQSVAVFDSDAREAISKLSSALETVDEEIRRPLRELQGHIAESNPNDYIPTGETPLKRDWSYPTTLPRTLTSPESTTPKHPPSSTFTRTPGKSPRKFASPRKSPKKQPVHVDTPSTNYVLSMPGSMDPPPPPKTIIGLKDIDINIPSSVPPLSSASEKDGKDNSSGGRPAHKSNRSGMRVETVGGRDLADRMEKENIHGQPPAKLSKSMYAPRMLRSSVNRRSPPDFSRSMSD